MTYNAMPKHKTHKLEKIAKTNMINIIEELRKISSDDLLRDIVVTNSMMLVIIVTFLSDLSGLSKDKILEDIFDMCKENIDSFIKIECKIC